VREFVERTTRASGVPYYLEDPVGIEAVAALLAPRRDEAAPKDRLASKPSPNPSKEGVVA
jgi:hypothetical protein